MVFVFEVRIHFFNVITWVFETIYIIQFFSVLCSKSKFLFSNGADGYNMSIFCSIYQNKRYTNWNKNHPAPVW